MCFGRKLQHRNYLFLAMNVIDLTGQKFNRWTVLSRAENTSQGQTQWLCICECQNTRILKSIVLRNGNSQSCGCRKNELLVKRSTKHGQSSERSKTPTWWSWSAMIARCRDKSNIRYADYGERGIEVCERWLTFANFYEDMGNRPVGMTLDRIDPDKSYCKDNCRWANTKTQARNRRDTIRLTHNGVTLPMREWAELLGVNGNTLASRLKRGCTTEQALTGIDRRRFNTGRPPKAQES